MDAIVFCADENFTPEKNASSTNFSKATKVLKMPAYEDAALMKRYRTEKVSAAKGGEVFKLENSAARIFYEKKNFGGKEFFERRAEIFDSGSWKDAGSFPEELVYVGMESENPSYSSDKYFSRWQRARLGIETYCGDVDFNICPFDSNPYLFEKVFISRPEKIEQLSDCALKLVYSDSLWIKAELLKDSPVIKFEANFTVAQDGWYSIGMLGFNSVAPNAVGAALIPPLFQNRSLMDTPKQLGNRMASQPYAMLQSERNGAVFTDALVSDPSVFPSDEWSKRVPENSFFGFSISNPFGKPQTAIARPILGGRDSFRKKGDTIKSSWYAFTSLGDWTNAVKIVNTKIFPAGNMFRHAYDASFSDAVANMAAFLKDERVSGWIPYMKGRVNIEGGDLVTNASPNTELEIALLTDDEQYYRKISLSVIEFVLSRGMFSHTDLPSERGYGARAVMTGLPYLAPDYYLALDKLLGGANPWAKELAQSVKSRAQNSWTSMLGMYLASPSPELLERTKLACDKWIEKSFHPKSTGELNYNFFINIHFYPSDWVFLFDLYKASGDGKYLEYARIGAYHSLASLWNYPVPPEGNIVINKGNKITGLGAVWKYMDKPYRLGRDLRDAYVKFFKSENALYTGGNAVEYVMPEKTVEAFKAARIGLTMEQPVTYVAERGHQLNIMMPSYASDMLEVADACSDSVLKNFSRHAIIGRFSNFAGYYVMDYMDVMHNELYPYQGPDITSFYYHHAPCHFAQTFDYLMAQFEIASKGGINFPHLRQKGYAWFTDRIFGLAGTVYGEYPCRLLLDKDAVRPDTPLVSTLLARSESGVWAFLLNDSSKPIKSSVVFDSASKAFRDALVNEPCALYSASGEKLGEVSFFGEKILEIPAQGIVCVRVPAKKKTVIADLPKMGGSGKAVVKNAHENLGDFCAYRIRSPFGKDSFFAFLQYGAGRKDIKFVVELSSPSKQRLVCHRFPFEVSAYPLPMDCQISGSAFVENSDGSKIKIADFNLQK